MVIKNIYRRRYKLVKKKYNRSLSFGDYFTDRYERAKKEKFGKGKNLKKRVNLIPLGRMATTNEVAKYIYFYSSKQNSLTTNEIIDISGGEK